MDYEKQATDFLEKYGVKFSCVFLRNGKHFPNDKDYRDIYTITLTRGPRTYSFNFGQSLDKSGYKIQFGTWHKLRSIDRSEIPFKKDGTIDMQRFEFLNNHGFTRRTDKIITPKAPTEYSVLSCLTKNDPGSFEDFCSEYGMNEDSIKDNETYKAVREEYIQLCTLFSPEEMEELQEIQ